jgi:hypothetical protein
MKLKLVLLGITAALITFGAQAQDVPPGDTIVDLQVRIPHGDYAQQDNPPCRVQEMNSTAELVRDLVSNDLSKSNNPTLQILRPVAEQFVFQIVSQAEDQLRGMGGDLAKWLVPDRYAECAVFTLDKTRYPQYRQFASRVYMAEVGGDFGYCRQRAEGGWIKCGVGWAAGKNSEDARFITFTVKNWSGDRTRVGRVFFFGFKEAGACPQNMPNGNEGVDCSNY